MSPFQGEADDKIPSHEPSSLAYPSSHCADSVAEETLLKAADECENHAADRPELHAIRMNLPNAVACPSHPWSVAVITKKSWI